jgi:hypothetical protein
MRSTYLQHARLGALSPHIARDESDRTQKLLCRPHDQGNLGRFPYFQTHVPPMATWRGDCGQTTAA